MYQSCIYLEVRVLLSAVPGVFTVSEDERQKKDINSAKEEFLARNNAPLQVNGEVSVQPAVLRKVAAFSRAVGASLHPSAVLEHLNAKIQEPPDDRHFTGFSVKVAEGGALDIMFHQKPKRIAIEEIRIEEDLGRLTRTGGRKARMDWTYAGCPLMRLRTGTGFELGEESELFLQELYTLLTYLKIAGGEAGAASVRCNAYVMLSDTEKEGENHLHPVKLRNLNSFNFVRKAINSELSRQEAVLAAGAEVAEESRLWNEERNATEPWQLRSGQTCHLEAVGQGLTVSFAPGAFGEEEALELPVVRRERFRRLYGMSRLRSLFLCAEKDRADYFEKAVSCGAPPMLAAHWMAGELMKLLNQSGRSIRLCRLTADKFAAIMQSLAEGKIHSGMAKQLMQAIFDEGGDVAEYIKSHFLSLLSTKGELEPFVDAVLKEQEPSVAALRQGDMAPLEYLTGCVMRSSGGRAQPQVVKALIKDKLRISIVFVLTMGGAISARKAADGTVVAGTAESLRSLLDDDNGSFPVQLVDVSSRLSEEAEPGDWARLIAEIKSRLDGGTANGIVVTHGADTLPYTAALLFWLFSASPVPVVLTTSSSLPSDAEGNEAKENVNLAVRLAREKKNGVYVAYCGNVYSALNLKYLSSGREGGKRVALRFANWNMPCPLYAFDGTLSQQFLSVPQPEGEVLACLLHDAARKLAVVRQYPGLPMTGWERLLDASSSVRTVILELYASGTGNMRNSDYSLKPLLLKGRRNGMSFFCCSQQESVVDFSDYATSADVWREGAVPMGALTTESVVALYFAASLIADTRQELAELMEIAPELDFGA